MGNNVTSFTNQKIAVGLSTVKSIFTEESRNNKKQTVTRDPKKISCDIRQLNNCLKCNEEKVGFLLQLNADDISKNEVNFGKSIVSGSIQNLERQKKYRIALNLQQIYQMLQIFHNFNFAESLRKSRASSKAQTPQFTQQTKSAFIQDQCIICMESKPTVVLPCAHSYCAQCTQKYISQKQQKLCPLCRKQFDMGRDSFEKELYQIIGGKNQDQQLIKHFRQMISEIMSTHNGRQLKKIVGAGKLSYEHNNSKEQEEQQSPQMMRQR